MRQPAQFSASEWLQMLPLRQGIRQLRNDALLSFYKRVRPAGLETFLSANAGLKGKEVALVIAFEQPWALDWQLEMAARNLPGATVLVFDNSRSPESRAQIRQVCADHGTPYFALPEYRTRHVNRSHGMAMTWVYYSVVRALEPRIFAFIDHDLIPVREVDFAQRLQGQPVFGLINSGNFGHWSTWAGYCVFRYAAVEGAPLNFLYDFSRELDTGGRNWNALYRSLDAASLRFASREFIGMRIDPNESAQQVECIDGRWIHIGGVGYNDNFERKFAFFDGLRKALKDGRSWDELRSAQEADA